MNTREPFPRLFAAWSDKFRLNDEWEMADVTFKDYSNGIRNFENGPNVFNKTSSVSFQAFIDHIGLLDEDQYNRNGFSTYKIKKLK